VIRSYQKKLHNFSFVTEFLERAAENIVTDHRSFSVSWLIEAPATSATVQVLQFLELWRKELALKMSGITVR
jgi:hypothetical protein